MKNATFIGLTLAAVFLTSAMFMPTTNAESKIAKTNFATCKVKKDNAEFFVSATEKTTKLKKGTSIQYVMFGNQGIAVVKAQIDGKWVKGEIQDNLLDCPDDGK